MRQIEREGAFHQHFPLLAILEAAAEDGPARIGRVRATLYYGLVNAGTGGRACGLIAISGV